MVNLNVKYIKNLERSNTINNPYYYQLWLQYAEATNNMISTSLKTHTHTHNDWTKIGDENDDDDQVEIRFFSQNHFQQYANTKQYFKRALTLLEHTITYLPSFSIIQFISFHFVHSFIQFISFIHSLLGEGLRPRWIERFATLFWR